MLWVPPLGNISLALEKETYPSALSALGGMVENNDSLTLSSRSRSGT